MIAYTRYSMCRGHQVRFRASMTYTGGVEELRTTFLRYRVRVYLKAPASA